MEEIATSRCALLAMTVVVGNWLRRFKQNNKLQFDWKDYDYFSRLSCV